MTTGLTQQTLRGEIRRVVYENTENGYSVIKIVDGRGVEHTLVGKIPGAHSGEHIEVVGHWEKHSDFGRQLKISEYQFTLPSTPEGIERYLASGILPGVGPKTAKSIVERFGEKTLDIMNNYSSRLKEVPGVGKKSIDKIRAAWDEQKSRSAIFVFLQGLKISSAYCLKIYKTYGDASAAVVKKNPYQLADEVKGIGFIMADQVAGALGIEKNSLERLVAGVRYAINQLTQVGHCCCPEPEFIEYAEKLLDVDGAAVQRGIVRASELHEIVVDCDPHSSRKRMIYPPILFAAEVELPKIMHRLASVPRHRGGAIMNIPPQTGVKLSTQQLSAVEKVGQYAFSIITGGPGVGKTTVVGEIVRRADAAKLTVALAAPTGRAAKRLAETSRRAAATIHRLLKWDPAKNCFVYNADRPLKCDLLIVDEVSMLDLPLALFLFRAVRPGTTVVLVGDADQLPSVGPGRVLGDFINSRLFAVTHLSEIFRQGAGSSIVASAHQVNRGQMPNLESAAQRRLNDFYWIEQDDPELALDLIVRMQCERIPQRFKLDSIRDIQTLTPMNRGVCGTINLNKMLQENLNPGGGKPQFRLGEKVFRGGDKVMQTVNNYDKKVFNGDMGRIGAIDTHGNKFQVYFGQHAVEYEFVEAEQLTLAYAITVHKSQGSEFPAVIIPILTQHYIMLQRNLIYTAMTRARQLLIFVGSRKALSIAVRNSTVQPRHAQLLERLLKT
ncbi:MAG: ATP-dependent RecD-like DNA helicase [Victivallaceae bacterium]|nr:ATP-dependent RecD-like DNA helicase [Victivallaceae bacterium]